VSSGTLNPTIPCSKKVTLCYRCTAHCLVKFSASQVHCSVCAVYTGDTFDGYIKRMRSSNTWGDAWCLTAASTLFKRPVWIFTVGSSRPMIIDRFDRQPSTEFPEDQSATPCALTLGFVAQIPGEQPSHYVSLCRRDTLSETTEGKILRIPC